MTTIGVNGRTFCVSEPGGAVQASIHQYRQLESRPELDVILFGHPSLRSLFPEATVVDAYYQSNSQVYGVIWEQTILPRLASQYNVDVLYCPNGNGPIRRIDVPVVVCVHDVNALKGYSSGIHQLYRSTVVPREANFADQIVTVSEFSKKEIVKHTSVESNKVNVIYNGIDQFYFGSESNQINLPDEYILFVGSMNPRKNIVGAIEGFKKFKKESNLTHKLVIIGPKNKAIFEKVDLEERSDIVLPGFVTKAELKYAYEQASVFLYPSFYEGFGLPPLEALACGTPVVASNKASLPEILNGYSKLVDPDNRNEICDALCELVSEPHSEKELAERQEYVKKFTWKRTGDRLADVISGVVDT